MVCDTKLAQVMTAQCACAAQHTHQNLVLVAETGFSPCLPVSDSRLNYPPCHARACTRTTGTCSYSWGQRACDVFFHANGQW
jgi:hypothetical protein